MIVLARGRFGSPLSQVLTQVRLAKLVGREDIAKRTGLSASTVARAITTLAELRMLRERPDLIPEGTIGRPSIPVEIDSDHYVTIGCHVGRNQTTVNLGDLRGKVLAMSKVSTPHGSVQDLARIQAQHATALLSRAPGRVALAAGLVAPWGDIGYPMAETGRAFSAALGLEVETCDHIAAIAAAEYSARPEALPGSTLYIYARDTIGFAMANEWRVGTEISRVGRLGHFPIGSTYLCRCERRGCLETVASNQSVAERAHQAKIVTSPEIALVHRAANQGNEAARDLLGERAEALGRVAAIVRDMVHPDRVILCGQAFTSYPPALADTLASFAATTTLPPTDVTFTRFRVGVQAVAASTAALRRVYDDPLEVVRARGGRGALLRRASSR